MAREQSTFMEEHDGEAVEHVVVDPAELEDGDQLDSVAEDAKLAGA